MKMIEKVNDIETSIESSKNFTIKASPKAFKILSSGLYSNKIRAIIRELSCNAYDSHIASNNSEPFIVHIPEILDENFYVKDFGTGLSENDIMNLYTTYFDSNKTDSNEFVGALGLGSKSPFSYTDSFIVESIYNRIKTIYLVYINEEDLPSISKLEENETDEHSGLTVKFSLNPDDIRLFQKEAVEVLSVFDNQPILWGGTIIKDQKVLHKKIDWNNKDYFIYRDYCDYEGCNAFMGNIIYPIDIDKLNLDQCVRDFIINRNIFIRFNIGDLDITPSREHLSYIKSTIKILEEKINSVFDKYIDDLIYEINNKNNINDMIEYFNDNVSMDIGDKIFKKIDRTKFIFDDIIFNKSRFQFYLNSADVNAYSLNLENDIRYLKIANVEHRKKSRIPYLSTSSTINILRKREYPINFYISFNSNDEKIYKYNSPYNSYVISLRKYKKSKLSEEDIISILKKILLISDIKRCDEITNGVDFDKLYNKQPIKYTRDMSFNDISAIVNWIRGSLHGFNSENDFENVDRIDSDEDVFYIAVNNSYAFDENNKPIISSNDKSYYIFLTSLFNHLNDRDIKIIFCRNKAIEYIKSYGIKNIFEYMKEYIKDNYKSSLDFISKAYDKNHYSYNIIGVGDCDDVYNMFGAMGDKIIDSLKDERLIDIINDYNHKQKNNNCIEHLNKDNVKKLFNIELNKNKIDIDLSEYKDLINIIIHQYSYKFNSISNLFNSIYDLNMLKEKLNDKI